MTTNMSQIFMQQKLRHTSLIRWDGYTIIHSTTVRYYYNPLEMEAL